MIEHVELDDWKSHKHTEMDFSGGINVLVGEMGSGKSSILEAITFALFGTLPSIQDRTIGLDDLIRRSPTAQDEATVTVTFSHDGTTYTATRTIKRDQGTKEAKLYEDDDLIAGPQASEVTDTVEDILAIDYGLFASIIFAEQNQLDQFLSLTPSERKDEIDRLLKLDRFEDARSNLVTLHNRIKDRHHDRKEDLDDLEESIDDEAIEEIEETVGSLQDELTDLREKREEQNEKIEDIKEEIKDLKEKETTFEELETKQTKLEAAIENLEEQLGEEPDTASKKAIEERIEEIQEELEDLEQARDDLNKRETQLEVAEEKKDRLEEELEDLRDKKEKREELEDLKDRIDEIGETLEDLKESRSDGRAERDQIEEALESLSSASQECPTCGQDLTEDHRKEMLEEYRDRNDELDEMIEEIDDEIDEKQERLEGLEDRREELLAYGDIDEQIEETEDELEDTKATIEELQEQMQDIKDDYSEQRREELEKRLDDLEDDLTYFDTKETIDEKQAKLETIEETIEDLAFDEERLEELEEKHSSLTSDLKVIRNTINSKEELLEEKRKRLEDLRDKQERLDELEEDVQRYGILRDVLGRLETTLERTQSEMRQQFVAQANETMQTVWDRVYPYSDYTSIRLRAGDDYILEIRDDRGDWYSVEGEVSGGERHTAALSLRIALSLVLAPGLKLLILDEPTHNLDERAIDDMAETLRTNVADLIDQLFLITHDDQLEAAVTGTLHHLRKKDTDHGLTEVEEAAMQ